VISFHWIRHGPTHQKTFVGWRDVPADLSDTARIGRLRAHLPRDAVVIASDLSRASATADAIAEGRARLPDHPDLREFHFGDWDGLHFSEVAARDPDLSRAYWESPGDIAPPNGESWNAAAARVATRVDALIARPPARHVIAVAHFGVILTQVQRALGVDAAQVLVHKIDPLSVTDLHFDGRDWQVGRINHAP
jgi:broad specificity phosphatase PhoE